MVTVPSFSLVDPGVSMVYTLLKFQGDPAHESVTKTVAI